MRFLRRAGAALSMPQLERRRAECAVKRRAIAFARLVGMRSAGFSFSGDAASYLSVGRQCLEHWRREWRGRGLAPHRRGRPETRSGRDVQEKTRELLERIGPSAGINTLRRNFPELGANEARRILAGFRDECRTGLRAEVRALHWLRPGTVWAMDHLEPPSPVDGEFPYILAVRDLASHFQLAALPQQRQTDMGVADALEDLFVRYGAPLVLKSDNGSCFIGMETQAVLQRWGVQQLVSPPYLPRYNGAIEAGIGQLKTRTHIIATQHNRPGRWTADDLEGAVLLANRTLRPWEASGPTPEERWNDRMPIAECERIRLRRLKKENMARYSENPPGDFLDRHEYQPHFKIAEGTSEEPEWVKRWNRQTPDGRESGATVAGTSKQGAGQDRNRGVYYRKVRRRSLSDAMVAMGLLAIRKRVIPLPIKRIIRLKIS